MRKTCGDCSHWYCNDPESYSLPDTHLAPCTLNPVWHKTEKAHFCGQHTTSYDLPVIANRHWQSLRSTNKWAAEDRQRRIDAEKKLKDARAKIRELKQAP